eukprot:3717574-Rhodomonas_salina.1
MIYRHTSRSVTECVCNLKVVFSLSRGGHVAASIMPSSSSPWLGDEVLGWSWKGTHRHHWHSGTGRHETGGAGNRLEKIGLWCSFSTLPYHSIVINSIMMLQVCYVLLTLKAVLRLRLNLQKSQYTCILEMYPGNAQYTVYTCTRGLLTSSLCHGLGHCQCITETRRF